MSNADATPLPNIHTTSSEKCETIELRQYTLYPHKRDVLIDLFDREFIETQEALGIRVMGQFRNLDDPDRFVWLRGFADMPARQAALAAFYQSAAWTNHCDVANATMIDWHDVLLLRPAWEGSAIVAPESQRAPQGAYEIPRGMLDASMFYLKEAAAPDLLDFCRDRMQQALIKSGSEVLGWYVTEPSPNNFPRLPVREGIHALVGFAMFEDEDAYTAFIESGVWQRDVEPHLNQWLIRAPESLRLVPTARSAMHR